MSTPEKSKLSMISTTNELKKYLSGKALKHKYYKNYTKLSRVATVFKNHAVYLSNGRNWNDVLDKENFNNELNVYVNFGLCLSYSQSENIAMWMLYSGNDGCMIDYDKTTIKAILDAPTISLGYFDKNKGSFQKVELLGRNDFEISIIDVMYYGEPKSIAVGKYYIKRSDEVVNEFDSKLVDGLKFCKKLFHGATRTSAE